LVSLHAGAGEALDPASPLVGRDREMAELAGALDRSRGGQGGLILIGGEAGIGKTRLLEALADRAATQGMQVLWGRCWDSGGAPAFWPWVQVLRTAVASRERDWLDAELGPGAAWISHLVPELGDRLPGTTAPPALESDQARFSLFDAVTRFLRTVSQSFPLLIVIDDLHAADRASLTLLEFLASMLPGSRMLVAVAYQDAAARTRPEVAALIGTLARRSRPLTLHGFGESDLAVLIEQRTGRSPPSELARALHVTTEGNPFYANEVVRLLAEEGQLDGWLHGTARSRLPLPDTVRETIRRRLEPLGSPAVRLLETAAVIGREFSLGTLEQVTGKKPSEVIESLDAPIAAGLISEVAGTIGGFRFKHGLIRETSYAGIAPAARMSLHRATAVALESRYGGVPSHLAELAHHWAQSGPAGDPARALAYATRAGEHAMQLLAFEPAAELFQLALSVGDTMGIDPMRRAELLFALGQARTRASDPTARETLISAADAARAVERHDLLAEAALAIHAFAYGAGRTDDALVSLLEEALRLVSTEQRGLRARLLARVAVTTYYLPESDQRRAALVEEAVDIARELDDRTTLSYVLINGQLGTWGPDTSERDVGWFEELVELTRETGESQIAFATRNRQIDCLLELDDFAGADAATDALEQMVAESPDPRVRAYAPLQKARRAELEGDWASAERLNAEATAEAAELHDSVILLLASAQLMQFRLMQRRPGEVEAVARRFADSAPGMPAWRAGLALAYCQLGRDQEARDQLERLAGDDFQALPRYNGWLLAMALLTDVCVHLDDRERARQIYALLLPFGDRNVIAPHSCFLGPVQRYLGVLAASEDRPEAAIEHLEAAREAAGRRNARPWQARIDLDEALVRAERNAAGDRGQALALVNRARDTARELDADWLEREAEELLRRLEGEHDDAIEPAPVGPVAASLRREGDVWAFAYEGNSFRVRDAKGIRYLAVLLSRPGVELHALALAEAVAGVEPGGRRPPEGLEHDAGAGGAGPLLDHAAKTAYRARLEHLRAELEEAESFNDPERATNARAEIEFLSEQLSAALGLGGRDREAASNAERARISVTKAIRSVIKRVTEHDSALGQELNTTVRTGLFCVHEPDPRRPTAWKVEP
jgi:hypothetical protein